MSDDAAWTLVGLLVWLAFAAFVAWLVRPRFRGGDLSACTALRVCQVYARLVHGLRVSGAEHVPARPPEGFSERPLIVVANHTAGVDPVLIQSALPFEVRWVMAQDMRAPSLEWWWQFGRIIFVDREKGDAAGGLREAMRHLKAGGTLGVFPEGGIERPERQLLPFQPGIGLLLSRSKALVLPVVIEGTPQVDPAWASLWRRSRSSLRFLPVIDFVAEHVPAGEVAGRLREVFVRATGWQLNDDPSLFRITRDPAEHR